MSNPFAAFAFGEPLSQPNQPQPRETGVQPTQHKPTPEAQATRGLAKASFDSDPECLWAGVDHFAQIAPRKAPECGVVTGAHDGSDYYDPTRKLAEYRLIAEYRLTRRATVDEFNRFLLSLHGPKGRYWALVVRSHCARRMSCC